MKSKLLAVAVVAPLLLGGCIVSVDGEGSHSYQSDWEHKERKNRQQIADLEIHMPIASVKQRMGTPDFNESYEKHQARIQVLFYRTQKHKGDGVTTKDECTPLVFKNGALVGWGETAYQAM